MNSMDTVKLEVTLELNSENLTEASIDSLRQQLNEVVAAAVEEKQIEIPGAEILDYGITPDYDFGIGRRY